MRRKLKPVWSDEELAAAQQDRDAWGRFFAGAGQAADHEGALLSPERARLTEVRARHERELLRYPNVVGVAVGVRVRQGTPTGEPCLVVLVERKLPADQLGPGELLPSEIEGVPVDVVESGRIRPLSS